MKARHDDLVEALDGMFDDHHGELAGLLLDQVAFLDAKIAHLHFAGHRDGRRDTRSVGVNTDGTTGPGAGTSLDAPVLNAVARLAEIPGISEDLARSVIAGTGLDITRFPAAAHLVSWAGLCPSTRQSGPRTRTGGKGQGNGYLRGSLGQAAIGAAGTTYLPRRALLPDRPPPRPGQSPGRRRAIHPGHHLAPARRPSHPLHRPRLRLLPGPHRHRPQAPQPHPADPGPRLRRHPHQGRFEPAPVTGRPAEPAPPAPPLHAQPRQGIFRSVCAASPKTHRGHAASCLAIGRGGRCDPIRARWCEPGHVATLRPSQNWVTSPILAMITSAWNRPAPDRGSSLAGRVLARSCSSLSSRSIGTCRPSLMSASGP